MHGCCLCSMSVISAHCLWIYYDWIILYYPDERTRVSPQEIIKYVKQNLNRFFFFFFLTCARRLFPEARQMAVLIKTTTDNGIHKLLYSDQTFNTPFVIFSPSSSRLTFVFQLPHNIIGVFFVVVFQALVQLSLCS